MRRFIGSLLAIVVAVLAVASSSQRTGGSDPSRTHTVTIENMIFSPRTLRIRAGDSVSFKNKDLFPHTATAKGPNGFDSGAVNAGDTWTVVPKAGDPIHYRCTFHPTMEGEIDFENVASGSRE